MKSEIQKAKIARMIEEIDETKPEEMLPRNLREEIRSLKALLKAVLKEMLEVI